MPRISIIAAIGKNRELGFHQELIWRIPEDLKRFKALTMDHPIIMGKRTFESIGRPLPGRTNIVLSSDPDWRTEGVTIATSLKEAIDSAKVLDTVEIFIIGGGSVYQEALPMIDRLYLTLIDASAEADVWFPNYAAFSTLVSEEAGMHEGLSYRFVILEQA